MTGSLFHGEPSVGEVVCGCGCPLGVTGEYDLGDTIRWHAHVRFDNRRPGEAVRLSRVHPPDWTPDPEPFHVCSRAEWPAGARISIHGVPRPLGSILNTVTGERQA